MSETRSETARAAAPGGVTAGGPRPGLALLVLAAAQLMVVLDATIVNVALPHIQRALGFSGTNLEWVVNAYALAFGGLLLLGGRAGDLLGRRKMFIAGLLLFSAASLAGGFADSQAFLLTARAVQGAGGALVAPAALSLITTTFPEGPPRTRAFGVYAAMSIAGGAIGLIGGGLLTTYASWRWVLFVNVPIGAAVALAAPRVLAENPRRRGRFDLPGAITGTAASTGGLYWLSRISEHDTYTSAVLGPTIVIGAGLALLFVTLSLVALNRVPEADSGVASSLLNTGQQAGGSIGLAVLGTVAWTVVAHSIHAQAARAAAAAARAGHPVHPGGPLAAAIYSHAVASGFGRGFLVAAGIALLTLIINIAVIRIRRADLAGTQRPAPAMPAEQAQPQQPTAPAPCPTRKGNR